MSVTAADPQRIKSDGLNWSANSPGRNHPGLDGGAYNISASIDKRPSYDHDASQTRADE